MTTSPKNNYLRGRLVYHDIFKVCQVLDYDIKNNEVFYSIFAYDHRTIKDIPQGDLRDLTFREFICHRRPNGEWKCGKNGLILSVLFTSFFLFVSVASFLSIEDSKVFLPLGIICLSIIGLSIIATVRNYMNKGM